MESKAYQRVLEKVINFISYKPRSRFEIERRLSTYLLKEKSSTKSEKAEIQEKVLDRLEELEMIDDFKVAREYVDSAISSSRAKNRKQLYKSLSQKGIDREVIEKVLPAFSDTKEIQNIEKEYAKRNRTPVEELSFKEKNKHISFLIRKGYKPDLVYEFFRST